MHCDWLLPGMGRPERHQSDPWIVHRSRGLSRLGAVSVAVDLALVCADRRRAVVLHLRLFAAAIAAQPRHYRAGAGAADADIRARSDPEQCDDLLLQGGLPEAQ